MKKYVLSLILILSVVSVRVQAQTQEASSAQSSNDVEVIPINSLRLDINAMSPEQTEKINSFISSNRGNRSFMLTMGTALLGTLVYNFADITVNEIMKIADIRKNQKNEWRDMIWNECIYEDSLSYINNLGDFYSEGSYFGALDPANLQFNGFTVESRKDGQDVLKFYCHVDTSEKGLREIYSHSKFRLVLDSMYFYPYRCHLPNMSANYIYPEEGKEYDRNTRFSFDDRSDLTVSLNFDITSSWYNEAIILAKDVELGSFSVQIPIDEESLTEDSVFIYKKGIEGMEPLAIAGDCFIVPRSYMPLPGGTAHWGTGEYNVRFTLVEECDITDEMWANWKEDYRCLRKMKKDSKVKDYFISLYRQNGNSVMRDLLDSASRTAIYETGL